jgi:hypothetical protein
MKNLKKIKINTGDYITNLYDELRSSIVPNFNCYKLIFDEGIYDYIQKHYKIEISNEIRNHISNIVKEMNKYKTKSFKEIYDLFDKFYIELQNQYELNENNEPLKKRN